MDSDLFTQASDSNAPLPHRIRPKRPEDLLGQDELLSKLLRHKIHSMILYGPPGCGKTTLATMIAEQSGILFRSLSAISSGVKELREVIEEGRIQMGKGLVLFVDEIHRFSKSQQDSLLHAVEAGWIYLIGATTENPSFEVIGPLLSRCQVYRLASLSEESLSRILDRAIEVDPQLAGTKLEDGARVILTDFGGGDARKMLRLFELAVSEALLRGSQKTILITESDVQKVMPAYARKYDRAGESHYDFISAFIKSVRGSDPDAALLYMASMLDGGEDPLFIARRLIILASEDIGNAAPNALGIAVSAFEAIERIGMPEGRIVLAQAVTFLASCPKSNAAYKSIANAMEAISEKAINIPNHLRNAPTKTHKNEGASLGYKYPHDFPGHYVDANYMPEGFEKDQYYFPTNEGQEQKLRDRLKSLDRKNRKYD